MPYSKERAEQNWYFHFEAAKDYHKTYGHLLVPTNMWYRGVSLRSWINRQRYLRKQGLLSADKISLLDSIGMNWEAQRKDEIEENTEIEKEKMKERIVWNDYYRKFKDEFDQEDPQLDSWLEEQLKLIERDQLESGKEQLLRKNHIFKTKVYQRFEKQAAREVFKNIVIYYKQHHTFPNEEDITLRLQKTLNEWCSYFNCYGSIVLSKKEYQVWMLLAKKYQLNDVKLKEKALKK